MRGRDITESENTTRTAVALINQTMAKRVWEDADPIGRRFKLDGEPARDWFTVVGIVADFRHYQGDSDATIAPAAYVPYTFDPTLNTGLTIRVASGDPAAVTAAVRDQIKRADAALPVFQVSTMEDLRQRSFWQFRMFGVMFFLVRRDRAGARVDRGIRRAVVFGLAAHARRSACGSRSAPSVETCSG